MGIGSQKRPMLLADHSQIPVMEVNNMPNAFISYKLKDIETRRRQNQENRMAGTVVSI
jgi:hypothetical protein